MPHPSWNMARPLRGHHLLCTGLFAGKGYSRDFSREMGKIVKHLREHPGEMVALKDTPDCICAGCPHLTPENTCGSDGNRVADKDTLLMRELGVSCHWEYTYIELVRLLREQLTEELFLKICGDCSWCQKGLCSFEKLKNNLSCIEIDTEKH